MATPTIHYVSLGCPKNRVDTEIMLGVSDGSGYALVTDPSAAEIIVVNTCGFIEPAKRESIDAILEMAQHKNTGRCRTLVVAGCLSQRYPNELADELSEVDHFLGSSDMLELRRVLEGDAARMLVGSGRGVAAGDPRRLSTGHHTAYLKITEGCDRKCSFCTIPSIRGNQRSRALEDLVKETRWLASQGVVEVNLVGQDTIAYGRDLPHRPTLARLVEALAEVPGPEWLRIHYLYPDKLDEALLTLFADHSKVLPYIDMPLQHAADAVLTRMGRGHGGQRLAQLVDRIRDRVPEAVMRSAFIVGHPGESDQAFDELCAFVQRTEFDHVGVFVYSPEEGTRSATMEPTVPTEVAEQRADRLMELQQPISRQRLERLVGTDLEVLVEGPSEESELLLQGRWWGQAPEVDGAVHLANGSARVGELRRARITAASAYDLVADLLGPQGERDAPPAWIDEGAAPVRLPVLGAGRPRNR